MDMGGGSMDDGPACKISMLWNWYTVDTCFISEQWHNRTVGAYAGSVIGMFFLVILIESVRRFSREYDRRIIREFNAKHGGVGAASSDSSVKGGDAILATTVSFRPTIAQQAIRSLFYVAQFGAGYMTMLMAMYYNGGIILAIFAGGFVGHFLSAWDTVGHVEVQKDCCC